MTNPDGTRTREEHRSIIIALAATYAAKGMDDDAAITKAGEEYRKIITQEGADKIAVVLKFLGIQEPS